LSERRFQRYKLVRKAFMIGKKLKIEK